MLKKSIIIDALQRLGELANEEGIELHICIYGGAAMILAYDNRLISKDVDVMIHPTEKGLELAGVVGEEMGLHKNWLNNEVSVFLSEKDIEGRRSFELPIECKGLKVQIPTANYLLAMKARACRSAIPGVQADKDDLTFLIRKLKISTYDQVQEQLDRFFPEDPIPQTSKEVIRRIIEEVGNE